MNRRHIALVFSRELLDYRRQRRVWRRLFLQPFLIIVMLSVPVLIFRAEAARERDRSFTVAVEGDLEAVPGLRDALTADPFDLRAVRDGARAVVSETVDAAVVVPDDARAAAASGQPVNLQVLSLPLDDGSRFGGEALTRRLAELRGVQATAALTKAGVPVAIATPFVLETVDLASASGEGTRFSLAQAIPPLLVIQLFGLMAAAEERLAGAKDRRVLEPLLLLPFRRLDILLGIGAATMSAGFLAAALLFLPLVVGLSIAVAAISDTLVGPFEVAGALLLGIALFGVVFTAVGLYAGARAHSGGEGSVFVTVAQVTAFALVSATPFLIDVAAEGPLLLVPVLGPMLLVRDAVAEGFGLEATALALVGTVVVSGLLLRRAVSLLDAEGSVLRSAAR